MNACRAVACALLLWPTPVTTKAQADIGRVFADHRCWIRANTEWERDTGDSKQKWAVTTVLYFGEGGEFAAYSGTIMTEGKRLLLAPTEGGSIDRGRWTQAGGSVKAQYRLVFQSKVMVPLGQKRPDIPGPTQSSSVSLEPCSSKTRTNRCLQFRDERFEAIVRLVVPDATSQFHISDATSPH